MWKKPPGLTHFWGNLIHPKQTQFFAWHVSIVLREVGVQWLQPLEERRQFAGDYRFDSHKVLLHSYMYSSCRFDMQNDMKASPKRRIFVGGCTFSVGSGCDWVSQLVQLACLANHTDNMEGEGPLAHVIRWLVIVGFCTARDPATLLGRPQAPVKPAEWLPSLLKVVGILQSASRRDCESGGLNGSLASMVPLNT